MKTIDCYWEKTLNCKTCEILVERNDTYNHNFFLSLENNYQYIVVKVPMNMMEFNYGLAHKGYILCEMQYKISINYNDFNFNDPLIRRITPYASFQEITSEEEFNLLLDKITVNMFSTDRISLDPLFGPTIGCKRYRNWMKNSYETKQSKFLYLLYKGERVGFSMYQEKGDETDGILNGLFTEHQAKGLGSIVASHHIIRASQEGNYLRKYTTSISSNNIPVQHIYNHLHFSTDNMYYVFIKHTKSYL